MNLPEGPMLYFPGRYTVPVSTFFETVLILMAEVLNLTSFIETPVKIVERRITAIRIIMVQQAAPD